MKKTVAFILLSFIILCGSIFINSCRKNESNFRATIIPFVIPPGFPQPFYSFTANPVTEQGFVLGKKLFYDGRLSKDGNFSCASCHQPQAAFTTLEHDRSHGYNNSHTLRNAPGLFNLAWQSSFKQDGSAATIEEVILSHINDPSEMAESIPSIISKLSLDTAYRRLFREAYGNEMITPDRILNSLKQFVISLVSADSKYDRVKRGEASFESHEQSGYLLFQSKCAVCHTEPLFTDHSFRNIGLPIDPSLNDFGRMRFTGKSSDSLKFRVPSLRNLAFTSYYTHDGRINTFINVIQHYRSSVIKSATLDPLLVNGISLSDEEVTQISHFLFTLTDSSFVNNPRYR